MLQRVCLLFAVFVWQLHIFYGLIYSNDWYVAVDDVRTMRVEKLIADFRFRRVR